MAKTSVNVTSVSLKIVLTCSEPDIASCDFNIVYFTDHFYFIINY